MVDLETSSSRHRRTKSGDQKLLIKKESLLRSPSNSGDSGSLSREASPRRWIRTTFEAESGGETSRPRSVYNGEGLVGDVRKMKGPLRRCQNSNIRLGPHQRNVQRFLLVCEANTSIVVVSFIFFLSLLCRFCPLPKWCTQRPAS